MNISVDPFYWDFKRRRPKPDCPNEEYIQKIILDKINEVQKQILILNIFVNAGRTPGCFFNYLK